VLQWAKWRVGMPSPSERDAGLRSITHLTKWAAVLATGLVAVFAGLAAAAHPGRAAHSSSTASPPAPAQPSVSQDPGSDPGLQPPAQAPAPSDPSVSGPVSGGS